jgi:predicted CoA-binding protein
MSEIDVLATDFFKQRRFVVTGYSSKGNSPANMIFKRLRDAGYEAYAVNPSMSEPKESFIYPSLLAVPGPLDGAVIVNRPRVTLQLVRECIQAKIPRIWIHNMLGTRSSGFLHRLGKKMSSVSDEAVRVARENGITVIPGGCPMQFLGPVDGGHVCIRAMVRFLGGYREGGKS